MWCILVNDVAWFGYVRMSIAQVITVKRCTGEKMQKITNKKKQVGSPRPNFSPGPSLAAVLY